MALVFQLVKYSIPLFRFLNESFYLLGNISPRTHQHDGCSRIGRMIKTVNMSDLGSDYLVAPFAIETLAPSKISVQSPYVVASSIDQRHSLGPLLFLMLINRLPAPVKLPVCLMFTGDKTKTCSASLEHGGFLVYCRLIVPIFSVGTGTAAWR